MSDDFTKEQKELYAKPVMTIMPAYNNEFTLEVHDHNGNFIGRFNAQDINAMLGAIRSEYANTEGPPRFEVN